MYKILTYTFTTHFFYSPAKCTTFLVNLNGHTHRFELSPCADFCGFDQHIGQRIMCATNCCSVWVFFVCVCVMYACIFPRDTGCKFAGVIFILTILKNGH